MSDRSEKQLAEEARQWEDGTLTPAGWEDAPNAVPRSQESVSISICLSRQMLEVLKGFAQRAGVGDQVLIAQWLDDRIRQEAAQRLPVVPTTTSIPGG